MNYDTTTLNAFMSVSPTTGAISIDYLGAIGIYQIVVIGTLPNGQTVF